MMTCTVHRGDGSQPVWHLNNPLSSIYGLPDPVLHDVNEYETHKSVPSVLGGNGQQTYFRGSGLLGRGRWSRPSPE